MIDIKKAIDIILISAAVAAVVVFVDKVVPDKILNASLDPEDSISIENTSNNNAGGERVATDFRFDMVIEDGLFVPELDIFAAAPIGGTEKDKNASRKSDSESDSAGQKVATESPENVQITSGDEDRKSEKSEEEVSEISEEAIQPGDNIDYSNNEIFRIEVDLSSQKVIVFHNNDILKEMVCSGGAPESPTPLGEYVTSQKIEYAWVERFNMGAYYWIRFFEDYLIHSVPFDENGEMIVEEFEKLGYPASHGCIRLKLEEAKWLYETLPLGVKVVIYQ